MKFSALTAKDLVDAYEGREPLDLSNAQAGGWVERLLGQQTMSGADRTMSPLEVVLLQDALKTACAGAGREDRRRRQRPRGPVP